MCVCECILLNYYILPIPLAIVMADMRHLVRESSSGRVHFAKEYLECLLGYLTGNVHSNVFDVRRFCVEVMRIVLYIYYN